jgi:hypothetical protein
MMRQGDTANHLADLVIYAQTRPALSHSDFFFFGAFLMAH